MYWRQLDQHTSSPVSVTTHKMTDLEQRLQQAWSHTLKLDKGAIQLEDNFSILGGDSVTTMKLVSVCRGHDLDITVANIFSHPTLSMMTTVVTGYQLQESNETPAFSLISQPIESALLEACEACASESDAIEDIYPCTPTQESLFTFSIKSATSYIAQRLAQILEHITLDAWKAAWEETVRASPVLRTRIVQTQESGLQQVILREAISWKYSDNLSQYLEQDHITNWISGKVWPDMPLLNSQIIACGIWFGLSTMWFMMGGQSPLHSGRSVMHYKTSSSEYKRRWKNSSKMCVIKTRSQYRLSGDKS
jgi:aryl carrier-like protein